MKNPFCVYWPRGQLLSHQKKRNTELFLGSLELLFFIFPAEIAEIAEMGFAQPCGMMILTLLAWLPYPNLQARCSLSSPPL